MKFAIALLFVVACVPAVQESSPMPNTQLKKQALKMRLRIAQGVQDSFDAKFQSSDNTAPVSNWRQTLTNGFTNGFAKSFNLVGPNDDADLTFEINVAEMGFEVAGAGIVWTGSVPISAPVYVAQIHVQADVIDKNNQVLAKAYGRPRSRPVENRDLTGAVRGAVESMYENLSWTFFKTFSSTMPADAPATPDTPATPAQ